MVYALSMSVRTANISKGRKSFDADKASRESPASVGKRKGGLRTQDAVYDPASVRHTRQNAAGKSWR